MIRISLGVIFIPQTGYLGTASFDLLADDGYGSSVIPIEVTVSDAPLINLDFVNPNPRLDPEENQLLTVRGDFADQADILLPAGYLNFQSSDETIVTVDERGEIDAVIMAVPLLLSIEGAFKQQPL